MPLATAGPGGNHELAAGRRREVPAAEEIPTRGKAADVVAAFPRRSCCNIYERMSASRKWETAMKDLFLGGKDGLYGAFHTYVGEEAIAVGVISALNDDDYIASTHRGHGHLIAKGGDLNKMSAEIFFKESGYNKGYGGSMHITDMSKGIMGMNGIVGASYYMAAGAALHGMVRGTKQVAVAFFGDGASASPYYFSAHPQLREPQDPGDLRQREQLPVHGRADGDRRCRPSTSPNTPRASTSRIILVDGNDVTAVYAATNEAVEWARAGKGPSMIEGDDLSLVRPRRVRRRPRRPGWRDGAAVPDRRGSPTVDVAGSDLALQEVAARQGPRQRRPSWRRSRQKTQAAVDASIEFARKSADPAPEAGVLEYLRQGRGRGDPVLQP